jgi:hypothetical protein
MKNELSDQNQQTGKLLFPVLGSLIGTLLVLNFAKWPLLPDLGTSWIAALAFAATQKLQFGREIIYTYGPLGHLALSTYSPHLVIPDLLLELFLKTTYATTLCLLSRRLPPFARACFLFIAFFPVAVDYQSIYLSAIVCAGWILIAPSRTNDILLVPIFIVVAIVALIKITFLWLALFVLLWGVATSLLNRRVIRALTTTAVAVGTFLAAWVSSGQKVAELPDFFSTAIDVTSGYSKTMSLPCPKSILFLGLATVALLLIQIGIRFVSEKNHRTTAWATIVVLAALFLSWKTGFSRADAHTAHFFIFAMFLVVAIPVFHEETANWSHSRALGVTHWIIVVAVTTLSLCALSSQYPTGIAGIRNGLFSQWKTTLRMLTHPSAEIAKWRADDHENSQKFALPRIKEVVASDPVDVFGFEQGVAFLNGLNYRPMPTVQAYCDYTSSLARINAAFYHSPRAPEYVIFKLQQIDNRLTTINCSEVLMCLLQDYDPLLIEKGYLLLKQYHGSQTPLAAQFQNQTNGGAKLGDTIPIPEGLVWCELELKETLPSKLLGFFYHSPLVQLETRNVDGEATQKRILPELAQNGFLINPIPSTESEFVQVAIGKPRSNSVIRTIRVIKDSSTKRFFRRHFTFRFWNIQVPPRQRQLAGSLADELNYTGQTSSRSQ